MSVAPIVALITNHALCLDCIAEKTGMDNKAAEQAIKGVSCSMRVDHYINGTCRQCHQEVLVYAIDRPPRR